MEQKCISWPPLQFDVAIHQSSHQGNVDGLDKYVLLQGLGFKTVVLLHQALFPLLLA